MGHKCAGHNYMGYNYVGHNYIGHNSQAAMVEEDLMALQELVNEQATIAWPKYSWPQ